MNWDRYFLTICSAVSLKSPCLSRQIGAILVFNNSLVSTGYNGPPRGIPHCEGDLCPRRVKGFLSGEGMEHCPAQHAEENAVSNAARNGTSTIGCTLYLNTVVPCSKCFGTLINAGIAEIVCKELTLYDPHTNFLMSNSNIKVRTYSL